MGTLTEVRPRGRSGGVAARPAAATTSVRPPTRGAHGATPSGTAHVADRSLLAARGADR